MSPVWLSVFFVISLAALALAIAGVVLALQKSHKGNRGRRGRRGPTGGPVGAGFVPWYMTFIEPFGAGMNSAALAYEGFQSNISYPINPNDAGTIALLNGGWAEIGPGQSHDLQIGAPPGSASVTGMKMFAQVWRSPACSATWAPTPLVASYEFAGTSVTTGICFGDHLHTAPFGVGDRTNIVFTTDTGFFTPLNVDSDGFSVGLGYTLL